MIYIDLDGVLADLEAYIIEKTPKAAEEEFEFFKFAFEDPKFFLDSPVLEIGFELLKKIQEEGDEYRILSSLPCINKFYSYAKQHDISPSKVQKVYARFADNKIEFCKKLNIPASNVILVNSTSEKIRYCQDPDDIIYDDRQTIVKEWTKKGGIGMLVPYNSRRKEYIGEEK